MRRGVILTMGVGAVLTLAAGLFLAASAAPAPAPATESATDEIPPALAPFEYLIGGWKGTGVPEANKLRGWEEKHVWAWKFAKGVPVGMTVEVSSGKTLTKGQMTFDPETEQYRLDATDPAGKALAFAGKLDPAGKVLTLDRTDAAGAGTKEKQRLRLQLNGNRIRYTFFDERKETGSPRFAPAIVSGMTKEGESLGGSGGANDGPKCIVTGGSATTSETYNGKSYPLCCTGCRDEFKDNPEKYVKKMALRMENAGKTTKASSVSLSKDDGSFDGLMDDAKPRPKAAAAPKAKSARPAAARKAEPLEDPADAAAGDAPAVAPKAKAAADPSAKAASLLRLAQALDKSGNAKGALGYYRQIVADYPDTPQAKTAAARVKALGK